MQSPSEQRQPFQNYFRHEANVLYHSHRITYGNDTELTISNSEATQNLGKLNAELLVREDLIHFIILQG